MNTKKKLSLKEIQNIELYLRNKFGNYENDPSEEQKKTHHQMSAFMKES